MKNLSPFCTCDHSECPIHPTKHEKGCAPCIAKNLKRGEIPNCMFHKIQNADTRAGDTYLDFERPFLLYTRKFSESRDLKTENIKKEGKSLPFLCFS